MATAGAIGPGLLIFQTRWWSWPEDWFTTAAVDVVVYAAVVLMVVLGNEAVALVVGMPALVWRLGRLPARVPLYLDPGIGYLAIGSLMFRVTLAAAAAYSVFLTAVLVCSPLGIAFGPALVGVFLFFAAIILLFFVSSLYGLHLAMVAHKHARLRTIGIELAAAFGAMGTDRSTALLERTAALQQLQRNLADTPVWPFGKAELGGIGGVILGPILVTVVGQILSELVISRWGG